MATLIRNVEVGGALCDVVLVEGKISSIATQIKGSFSTIIEGQGGALLPGLHDHHIHLNATAAAMNSIRCGPPEVNSERALIKALNAPGEGELRGVGYHHSVAGEINRTWLDNYGPKRPIRIQHRSGRLWILNSLAIENMAGSVPDDGRLLDADGRVRKKVELPDLQSLISRLHSYGVTGVTEVTPSNGAKEITHYLESVGDLRLTIMGGVDLSPDYAPYLKLHYHENELPSLETLRTEISNAHNAGRKIAAHCVTRAELMLTLAAIEEAGPLNGDRIEHAAIADDHAIKWMKKLGLIVVTQPNFIVERAAAYLKDVHPDEHQNLWRLKAFIDADLRVAAGSDAPFGDPNPWKAMAAAVRRPIGFQTESISPEAALSLYTKPAFDAGGHPRQVSVGSVADLCLLDQSWKVARKNLKDVSVKAAWIEGKLVFNAIN